MDGTILDGFRLTARLGRGEDGEVYRAEAGDGTAWAVRVLPRTVDHGRVEGIQRAVAALTRAAVPGVLIPRWIAHGPTIALATPLLDGEGLDALLGRLGRLPWAAVREIGVAIATTLGGLHRAGIVFGGLRPGKCFVDRSGRIWLIDVGVSENRATPAGAPWMSPEQAAEAQTLDARADVYALGAILHALLAGEPPFTGAPPQLAMMHRFKAPRPLRKIDRSIEVPTEIEAAILRALEKDPRRRFAAVDDLAELLADAATPGAPYVPGATLAGVLGEECTVIVQPLAQGSVGAPPRGSARSGVIDDRGELGAQDVDALFAPPTTSGLEASAATPIRAGFEADRRGPTAASVGPVDANELFAERAGSSVPATIELPRSPFAVNHAEESSAAPQRSAPSSLVTASPAGSAATASASSVALPGRLAASSTLSSARPNAPRSAHSSAAHDDPRLDPVDASEPLLAPSLVAQPGPRTLAPSEDAALPAPAGATPPPWLRGVDRGLLELRRDSDEEGPATLVSAPPLLGAAAGDATALLPVYAPESEREPGQTALIPGFGGDRLFGASMRNLSPGTGSIGQVPSDMSQETVSSTTSDAARAPLASEPSAPRGAIARSPASAHPARRTRARGLLDRIGRIPALLRRGWQAMLAPLRRLLAQRSRLLAPFRALRGRLGRITRLWSRWSP
ncbi:MAG: protein kinase [Nannocystaceae bacterium]